MLTFETFKIHPRTLLIRFANSFEMNMTMVRLQEFAEGPVHTGQVFTLEEYMNWYAYNEHKKNKKAPLELGFDYLTRGIGCNVTDRNVDAFFALYTEDMLSERERWLCDTVTRWATSIGGPPYYLITYYGGTKLTRDERETIQHEVAHVRFAMDLEYRNKAMEIIRRYPCPSLYDACRKRGYGEHVVLDEAHAFALTGWPKWYPWYQRPPLAYRLKRALREALPIFDGFPLTPFLLPVE